jgi:hypothetical protein
VIAVEVREDEQVDLVDPEQVEAGAQPRGLVAGVDERRPARAADDCRVPLPDVAHRDRPSRRYGRPGDDVRHRDGTDADEPDDRRDDGQRPAEPPADQHGRGQRGAHGAGDDDTGRPGGPRGRGCGQVRCEVRSGTDGRRRPPPHGGEHPCSARPDGRQETRAEPGHGGDGCQQLGEQVRRHGVGRQRR